MVDEERQGEKAVTGDGEEVRETALDEIVGCTGSRGPARSLEETEEAIEREARRQR